MSDFLRGKPVSTNRQTRVNMSRLRANLLKFKHCAKLLWYIRRHIPHLSFFFSYVMILYKVTFRK